MLLKNNGQEPDHIVQNQFTAYLVTATHRKKSQHLSQKNQWYFCEVPLTESGFFPELPFVHDLSETLPWPMQMENSVLQKAMKSIKERERYVFLSRVLEDKSFEELAAQLGMGYKGVAAIYYRAVQKIRAKMKEANDEFY